MAYVIAAPCVADYSCLEICPVDCISPGPNEANFSSTEQLYIDPATCINCGACVNACPVDAIFEDDNLPTKWNHYAAINREYFAQEAQKAAK